MKHFLYISFIFFPLIIFTQEKGLNKLDEVILYTRFSEQMNSGYQITVITDSILQKENISLGNLLQKQSNIYFKQNGYGMVSSISMRGSSASHTGVYWNGIEINSSLNGQTDFNTFNINGFNTLEIRKGGGSVLSGSGAIGGAINLKDNIQFDKKPSLSINGMYGSYDTFQTSLLGAWSDENIFIKISGNFIKSENDYPYLNTDLNNENGDFLNYSVQGVIGWKLNKKNQIGLYTMFVNSDRNTSRTLTAQSNAKLLNVNNRVLLEWKNLGNRLTSLSRVAYLKEKYTYFFNKNINESSNNESDNLIVKYDFTYFLNSKMNLKGGLDYTYITGNGDNISKVSLNNLEPFVLFHHDLSKKIKYNLSIRKGISDRFDIPFIYSIDGIYSFSNKLNLKANYSTNYRLPTINDLFWMPGGNINLKPEDNKSFEVSINFSPKTWSFQTGVFFTKSDNLIQWIPINGDIWQPVNVNKTSGYGVELESVKHIHLNNHNIQLTTQYSYTISENDETKKQLIYIPKHKANTNIDYHIKKWNINYNLQYTGSVFTTSSNSKSLKDYWISNIGVAYNMINTKLNLGLNVNNIFNKKYQSVAFRPMPNRNFNININYKIK